MSDDEFFEAADTLGNALNQSKDESLSDSDREANKVIADLTAARLVAEHRKGNV